MSDDAPTPETPRWARVVFALSAASFAVTAVVHAVRAFHPPTAADPSGPLRHTVFVLINLAAIAGVLRRPRWFALPFAVLVAQQLSTHGWRALQAVQAGAPPFWEDVLVTVFLPTLLVLLIWDAGRTPSPSA